MGPTDVAALERFWQVDTGVFFRLREGTYVPSELEEFIACLKGFEVDDEAPLPRRVVSLLWFVPSFLAWQEERIVQSGGDLKAYRAASTAIMNELQRILGVP